MPKFVSVSADGVVFYPRLWTREGRGGQADAHVVPADENLRLRLGLLGYEVVPADP